MRTTDSDPPTPPSMTALLEQLDAVLLGDDAPSRRTSNASYGHPQPSDGGVRCGMSSESEYEVVYRPATGAATGAAAAAAPSGSAGEGSTSREVATIVKGAGLEATKRPNSSRSRRGKKQDAKGVDFVSISELAIARPRQLGTGVAEVAGVAGASGTSAAGAGALALAGADAAKKKKTRRSGRKARRRLDNGQMRETAAVEDELGLDPGPESESETSASSSSNGPLSWRERSSSNEDGDGDGDEYSEDGASRFLDGGGSGEDEEDEDEVDALSDLGSVSSERSDVTTTSASTMSREEARSAIDSFLSQTASFTSDKANKLLLWQALCLEFGLVQSQGLPDLPDLPSVRPSRSPRRGPPSDTSRSRSATPTPSCPGTPIAPSSLPGLPQSLNQAMRILKTQAHVNLVDYFDARNGDAVANLPPGQPGVTPNDYSSLVFPSTAAMQRYTRKEKRFADLGTVKAEWLQPLLKDFGFKRSRGAASH